MSRSSKAAYERRSRSGPITKLLVALALLTGACSDTEDTNSGENAEGLSSELNELAIPADLEFLGGLAGQMIHTEPVAIDETGGSLSLQGDAVLTFPQGALMESTQVTVSTVDLAFGKYLDDPLSGSVYRISTDVDVVLAEPVVLEVPRSPEEIVVSVRINGLWQPVAVPEGPTAKVAIEHFSVVTISIVDRPDLAKVNVPPATDGFSPAVFLESCILMMRGPEPDSLDEDKYLRQVADLEYRSQLALSVCTRALVTVLTPPGQGRVSTECVGDKIGGDVDIRGAIAACVEERNPDEDQEIADSESPAEPSPELVDPSGEPRVWQGEFVEIRGTATWSTTRTTRVNIEEQADGTLTMTRETDEDHTQDAAVFSPACPYIATEDASYGPSSVAADGDLRFTGEMSIGYIVNDCGEQGSGPAPGTYPDIVTGTLTGDTLTLDAWYDGQGPVKLDPPSTG